MAVSMATPLGPEPCLYSLGNESPVKNEDESLALLGEFMEIQELEQHALLQGLE